MTKDQIRAALVKIAAGEVGQREQGGNNKGARVRLYQSATWLHPDAWPWCAAFVCWAIKEWLKVPGVAEGMNLTRPESWRPKTAGAFDFARWAREKNLLILPESAEVFPGDIVIYDFSHIGIITDRAIALSVYIEAIEGNTNGKGERDSTSGDGVWRKTRARGLAKQFIRLA